MAQHLIIRHNPPPPLSLIRLARGVAFLVCATLPFVSMACTEAKSRDAAASQVPLGSIYQVKRVPPIFVEDQAELRCDMPVKNETGRPVHFTRVQPGCSCSAATTLDLMELAPGEETTLHFEIDLRNRKGPQLFICRLMQPDEEDWTYAVETTLYERAQFTPIGSTIFGLVDPNTEHERGAELRLYAESEALLPSDVSFRSDSDDLRVEAGAPTVAVQSDGFAVRTIPLKLRLHSPGTAGLGQASVWASYERHGEKQQLQTGVSWNVRTLYSLSPPQVYFGTVAATASPVERRVILRRSDGKPLEIKDLKASSPAVSCSSEKKRGELEEQLLLVLDPKQFTGPLVGEVVVETRDPVHRSVKIPFAAIPERVP
jgi:hypothetical protein